MAHSINIEEIKYSHILINLIKSFPPEKLVFFVGAGIDMNPPTCLPSTKELLKFTMQRTCGTNNTDSIFNIWEKNKSILEGDNSFIPEIPRLETIFEEIFNCENNMKRDLFTGSFLKGLSTFSLAPPNNIHYVLANLMSQGANIITTNYDSCVHKAYKDLFNEELSGYQEDGVMIFESALPNSGKLHYIHGIATEIQNLGITLQGIKHGFGKHFRDTMNLWLKSKTCFIFLGYSGSDSFDVNRYFLKYNDLCSSTGIFIRHDTDNSGDIAITRNEEIILGQFQKKIISRQITKDFVSFLSNVKVCEHNTYEWKKEFTCESTCYPVHIKDSFLLSICWALGLNVLAVNRDQNWERRAQQTKYLKENYLNYYIFAVARLQGNVELLEKYYWERKNNKDYERNPQFLESSFLSSIGDVENAYKSDIDVTQLRLKIDIEIKSKKPIDWFYSSPLNNYSNYIASEIMEHPDLINLISQSNELKDAIYCLEKIYSAEYLYLYEVRQVASALKNMALFYLLQDGEYEKAINCLEESSYLYSEISSMDGIISYYTMSILINSISYYRSKNNKHLNDGLNAYEIALRLIENNKLFRHTDKLEKCHLFLLSITP